ncbi:MAG: hypothetical protein Q8N47_18185 [Bryobacterales bacterium]|nr:hypothetical protein [Bryobacterales bacterium]
MFSVGSEPEAGRLPALACPLNYQGESVARELAATQTLENLDAFGRRLQEVRDRYLAGTERCECQP